MASNQPAITAQARNERREQRLGNEHNTPRKRSRDESDSDSRTQKRPRYNSAPPVLTIDSSSKVVPPVLGVNQDIETSQTPKYLLKRRQDEDFPTSKPKRKRVLHQSVEPAVSERDSLTAHWVEHIEWPPEAFEPEPDKPQIMSILFALKKTSQSLRRKWSQSSITESSTPSDQKLREVKTSPYTHSSYPLHLEARGVRMTRSELGITDASKTLCRNLLETRCEKPSNTLFEDNILEDAIQALQGMNESRVIQDIARLLVPSAETLARTSEKRFDILVESVNEGWDNCFPLTDPQPQPDYAAGFGRSALGDSRITKLRCLVGDEPFLYQSCLMATRYMYFPFLTSEVKCGTAGLELADRQNAHSMGIAVRAIVLPFMLARRHMELHRRILTFSISHNHDTVRLHGWYIIIDGTTYTIHRHVIRSFDLLDMDGRDKWTAYSFSIGIYRYAVGLLKQINAVIDELPANLPPEIIGDLDCLQLGHETFQAPRPMARASSSRPPESNSRASEHSGLSQELGRQNLNENFPDSQPSEPLEATPGTSVTEQTGPKRFKT
ncbi:hypothetical protein ACMFMG_008589 [Clarireedia jacksonii]